MRTYTHIFSCLFQLLHNQGQTLTCLAEKLPELKDDCKQELLRVAELQADDYHKDRQLYYACREDRENFCHKVKAGEGRIYKCLFRHKFDPQMSENVRKMSLSVIFAGIEYLCWKEFFMFIHSFWIFL